MLGYSVFSESMTQFDIKFNINFKFKFLFDFKGPETKTCAPQDYTWYGKVSQYSSYYMKMI